MKKKDIPVIEGIRLKRIISVEGFVTVGVIVLLFGLLSSVMGFSNLMGTLFQNAFSLLTETVLYITAVAVVAGALSAVLTEFGIIALANKTLAPLMKPVYGMPGATVIGVFTTYLSDNPAILTLSDDVQFRRYFKKYQLPALCNLGTSFGMGLIVTVALAALGGKNFGVAILVGNVGALVGSIISTRLMLWKTKRLYGTEEEADSQSGAAKYDPLRFREVRKGSWTGRLFDALLEGGASGVKVGVGIIPGVLIICNLVMILIMKESPNGGYTGAAFEGVNIFGNETLAKVVDFIFKPLFGFSDVTHIAAPLTALGSSGASLKIVEAAFNSGTVLAGDIAVFTAMLMCWSGYLSTHVAMMDSLKFRNLTGWAILAHTLGGLGAGVVANYLFKLVALLL